MSLINTQVQPFKVNAFHNGKFIEVTEESLKGKWSVLIFMPAAFTFNCPTEIEDAANNYAEFQKAGAEVYIVTTDTHFSHKVWHETSPAVGKAQFPLIGDPTHQLTRAFGVHIEEEGLALRGTFVINPEGVIKTVEIHSNEIARDVGEDARMGRLYLPLDWLREAGIDPDAWLAEQGLDLAPHRATLERFTVSGDWSHSPTV